MAEKTRVLIVDDSVTMRALFTAALGKSSDIIVLDSAANADEAREMIPELKPDVITLDVEMPGMNGIDFLAELMSTAPMPVIMLSTLTQKGADVSLKAMELGAVECLPKPQAGPPEGFEKDSGKVVQRLIGGGKSKWKARGEKGPPPAPAACRWLQMEWLDRGHGCIDRWYRRLYAVARRHAGELPADRDPAADGRRPRAELRCEAE